MTVSNSMSRDSRAKHLTLPAVLDRDAAISLWPELRDLAAAATELRIDAASVRTLTYCCAQVIVSALRSHPAASIQHPSEAFVAACRDLGLDWMPERSAGLAREADSIVPEAASIAPEADDIAPAESADALRILTIDDSRTIRDMLATTLNDGGFDVVQAENGALGVELAARGRFDLVITDINMPVMDGYGVIRHLRVDPVYEKTPILVLTTESDTKKRGLAREAGATGWLVKPFDPEKLIATIIKVLPAARADEA